MMQPDLCSHPVARFGALRADIGTALHDFVVLHLATVIAAF
jgi:hypothetical protein